MTDIHTFIMAQYTYTHAHTHSHADVSLIIIILREKVVHALDLNKRIIPDVSSFLNAVPLQAPLDMNLV